MLVPSTVVVIDALSVPSAAKERLVIPDSEVWLCDAGAAPISPIDQLTFAEPLTDLDEFPICIFLAAPQLAVVIFPVPSKLVPLIVLAVANFVADVAEVAEVAVAALPCSAPLKVVAVASQQLYLNIHWYRILEFLC